MSDKPQKEPKPPGRIARFFSAIAAWPRSLSLPVAASLVLALFLGIAIIVVWLAYRQDPNNVPWGHYMTGGRLTMLLVLYLVTPLLFYGGLKYWLEGMPSDYPEIDYAWKAGLKALKDHGLSLESLPLFLVLGSTGEEQERALADAAGFHYRVRGVPEGPAPLHWYANADRIDLFLTNAGSLSLVSEMVEKSLGAAELSRQEERTLPQENWPGRAQTAILSSISPAELHAAQSAAKEAAPMGTMVHKTLSQVIEPLSEARSLSRDSEQMRLVTPAEVREAVARLEYVCQKIQIARHPLCGINGILTLMRFRAIRMDDREAQEIERALRFDLRAIQRQLQVRCPVTALIFGLQNERGFRELVRRVGREKAISQRFGHRFDIRSEANATELAGFTLHVCGVFEDWIYRLFNEPQSLSRPGNMRLYGLLCKVRSKLQPPLIHVFANGFGHDPALQQDTEPHLFSGCYFAATGDTDDRRAFVRGVFEKMLDEQEELEWTQSALARNLRYSRGLFAGMLLVAALGVSLIGMMIYAVSRG